MSIEKRRTTSGLRLPPRLRINTQVETDKQESAGGERAVTRSVSIARGLRALAPPITSLQALNATASFAMQLRPRPGRPEPVKLSYKQPRSILCRRFEGSVAVRSVKHVKWGGNEIREIPSRLTIGSSSGDNSPNSDARSGMSEKNDEMKELDGDEVMSDASSPSAIADIRSTPPYYHTTAMHGRYELRGYDTHEERVKDIVSMTPHEVKQAPEYHPIVALGDNDSGSSSPILGSEFDEELDEYLYGTGVPDAW
jgi:hypothetical protein